LKSKENALKDTRINHIGSYSSGKPTNVIYFCGGVQNKNEEGCFLASLTWCMVRVKSTLLEKTWG